MCFWIRREIDEEENAVDMCGLELYGGLRVCIAHAAHTPDFTGMGNTGTTTFGPLFGNIYLLFPFLLGGKRPLTGNFGNIHALRRFWAGLVLAAARKELFLLLEVSPTCRILQDRPKGLRRGVGNDPSLLTLVRRNKGELSGLGGGAGRK